MGHNVMAIDHGNAENKTYHAKFTNNFVEENEVISYLDDYIKYNGIYYYPTEEESYFVKDKTETINMLIGTLYGIVIESKKKMVDVNEPITLAIGLPPSDVAVFGNKYKDYFFNQFGDSLEFAYGNNHGETTYKIKLNDVFVFPQDYAAIVAYKPRNVGDKEIKRNDLLTKLYSSSEYLAPYLSIDIGGYTTDLVYFVKGKPVKSTTGSRETGVIRMTEHIIDRVMREGLTLNREKIMGVLMNTDNTLSEEITGIIKKEARAWAQRILNDVRTAYSFDISVTTIVFVGGGSILLEEYLTEIIMDKKRKANQNPNKGYTFIRDSNANAKGYHILATDLLKRKNG